MNFRTSEDPQPVKMDFGNKFQQRLDAVIGTLAPRLQLSRMQARAAVAQLHQYAGARTGTQRGQPQPLRNPDSPLAQSDSHVMTRRTNDLGRDSAFVDHLINQYKIYALGDISYIPATGDHVKDQLYRDYWQEWMGRSCVQGRFHFIDQIQLALAGIVKNGRSGLIHHHNTDGTFQLQGVMGYNIGNPRAVYTNAYNVQGIVIDETGTVTGYDLYRLGINNTVHFIQRVPAPIFSCLNPVVSVDEYSAKTPLHAILNDAHDMKLVENAWMEKIQWAALKTAVFNTPNGSPPAPDPNHNALDGPLPGSIAHGKLRHQFPGEELHGEDGFNVSMVDNTNPQNNETDFLVTKLQQIASALSLPLPFVWIMVGLPGTYTRLISKMAGRAFQYGPLGQKWLERTCLNEIKNWALLAGINRGEIPWTKKWNKGEFLYPAHPSTDDGNDSKANLDENRQGITSMATITAEEGRYWKDVDEQLASEAENKMILAARTAERFNAVTGEKVTWRDTITYIQSLNANPPNPTVTETDSLDAPNEDEPDKKKDSEKLGEKIDKLSLRLEKSFDPSESRDDDGKLTDSGGSSKKGKSDRKPVKASPQRTPAPDCDDRCQRAKATHVMVDKGIQRYAEEHNEPRVAEALGGVSFPDGEPIDIAIAGENGVVQHGVELKTIVKNSNGKITMKGDAIARKAKWERKNKAKIHTIVVDDTDVFNAGGEGKHDESKRKIYYANGYGSFRIATMHQVKDMEEVKKLMNTPYGKPPQAAKKR